MSRLAVVIPSVDSAWCLGEQLAAVMAEQSSVPFEVVVADNGSSDNTREVARLAGARWIDASSTPGPAAARNAGV